MTPFKGWDSLGLPAKDFMPIDENGKEYVEFSGTLVSFYTHEEMREMIEIIKKEKMAKLNSELPLGKDTPVNVAVKRPTVNLKEAENVGEQAAAAVRQRGPVFAKHGTYWPTPHPIEAAYGD